MRSQRAKWVSKIRSEPITGTLGSTSDNSYFSAITASRRVQHGRAIVRYRQMDSDCFGLDTFDLYGVSLARVASLFRLRRYGLVQMFGIGIEIPGLPCGALIVRYDTKRRYCTITHRICLLTVHNAQTSPLAHQATRSLRLGCSGPRITGSGQRKLTVYAQESSSVSGNGSLVWDVSHC